MLPPDVLLWSLSIFAHILNDLEIFQGLWDDVSSFWQIYAYVNCKFDIFFVCELLKKGQKIFVSDLVEMNIVFFLSSYANVWILYECVWFSLGVEIVL